MSLSEYQITFLDKTSLPLHVYSRKTCMIMKTFEAAALASADRVKWNEFPVSPESAMGAML